MSCRMNKNNNLKSNALVAENWCHTKVKVHYCSYMWTVHRYMKYHYYNSKVLESSKFKSTTNDRCIWSLELNKNCNGIMLLYLVLNSHEKWCEDVLVEYKLSIINGEKEETNIKASTHFCKLNDSQTRFYDYVYDFFKHDDIHDEKKLLLTDDKLTIFCEFQFTDGKHHNVEMLDTSGESTVTQSQCNLECNLHMDLEHLFETENLSDFTISLGGKNFKVHKNILAARSSVFASMLEQDMKERNENCLEITDLDPDVLTEMLRYIYTGKTLNLDIIALDLLKAADKYDLQPLKSMCEYAIIKNLSVETVVDVLISADSYHATLLKKQAIKYMKIHLEDLVETSFWCKFKESDLCDDVFSVLLA